MIDAVIMMGKVYNMPRNFSIVLLILLKFLPCAAFALSIVGTPPTTPYDRFTSWTPLSVTQTPNPAFWASAFDLSPVGWRVVSGDQRMSATLVTPLHAVAAHHFNPGVGAQFAFRDTTGFFHTRTVTATTQVGTTDGLILTFDTPLPSAVSIMPVWIGASVGQNAYLYGQNAQLANGNFVDEVVSATIGPYTGLVGRFDELPSVNGSALGQSGDSGSPALLQWSGAFALFGPHLAIGSYPNPPGPNVNFTVSTFMGGYVGLMNTIVGADGYSITVVPEPNLTVFIALILVAAIAFSLRGRIRYKKHHSPIIFTRTLLGRRPSNSP